jgi:hypothetical protein
MIQKFDEFISEERGRPKNGETKSGNKIPGKYLTKNRSKMKKEIEEFKGKDKYKKDWDADYKSGEGGKGKRYKTKKSKSTKAFDKMFNEDLSSDDIDILKKYLDGKGIECTQYDDDVFFSYDKKDYLVTYYNDKYVVSSIDDRTTKIKVNRYDDINDILPKLLVTENKNSVDTKGSSINKAVKKKSDVSGISMTILKQVYKRGAAAWNSGHRPGVSQQQWALGRVNSFITGEGGGRKADNDLWEKVPQKVKDKIKNK